MSCRNPVLFIVFNRPDTTERVFEAIRRARPARLFVAADGPRADRPLEAGICAQVRSIATRVDWPCELVTLFRDENLGCQMGVSGAIDWFFENVEQGIILEDDCLPIDSFFPYCDELLDRYAHDSAIAQICGSTFISKSAGRDSYYFTKYADIWGWATWRRAWRLADMTMADWPEWRDGGGLERLCGSTRGFVDYWRHIFDSTHAGKVDTWDYQWMYTCWKHGLMSIMPISMQIQNIGFDSNATHTFTGIPDYVIDAEIIEFPIRHPDTIVMYKSIEREISNNRYYIRRITEWVSFVNTVPFVGNIVTNIFKKILIYFQKK